MYVLSLILSISGTKTPCVFIFGQLSTWLLPVNVAIFQINLC